MRLGVKTATPLSTTAESGATALNALAKIDYSTTSRLRMPILGNTIGNLVAGGIQDAAISRKASKLRDEFPELAGDKADHPVTQAAIERALRDGFSPAQIRRAFSFTDEQGNQPYVGAYVQAEGTRVSATGRITQAQAESRVGQFVDDTLASQASPPPTSDDATGPLSDIVVTGVKGPSGGTIAQKAISAGAQGLNGFVEFQEAHPILASVGYNLLQPLISGGPVKTIAFKLGGVAVEKATDSLSNYVADKSATFFTALAEQQGFDISFSIAGNNVSIGSGPIGQVAGQVLGSAVNVVANSGIGAIVARGRTVGSVIGKYSVGPYSELTQYSGRQERIILSTSSNNHGSPSLGVVHININQKSIIYTSKGAMPQDPRATVAHELGHVTTGILDDGPRNMNNVNANENPVRLQLGLPKRIKY
jgi:hypothetical protein